MALVVNKRCIMTEHKTEKKIDKELKDTFPASDPPSSNVFVGAPSEEEKKHAENCGYGHGKK